VSSVRLIKEITANMPETEWVLQYSPEVFTSTELDIRAARCAMPSPPSGAPRRANKVILNLPATVEVIHPQRLCRPDRVDAHAIWPAATASS